MESLFSWSIQLRQKSARNSHGSIVPTSPTGTIHLPDLYSTALLSRAHAEQHSYPVKNLCIGTSERRSRPGRSFLRWNSTERFLHLNGALTRCLRKGRG